MDIEGQIIDIEGKKIFSGVVSISEGKIITVEQKQVESQHYILPGFIDSHVHIESSMLPPSEFARLSVVHGTVATVSDPHEIGNVLGKEGVLYMINDASKVNFKFYFGVPSCVPATSFETSGASIALKEIEELFMRADIKYLAEMMNWPGVLNQDPEVMDKIELAKKMNKKVDGHAPGLMGDDAAKYIDAGITTDHECFTSEEALNKLKHGMKIIIREGSAAKNFEALIGLLPAYYDQIMFCSDDKHPDNLVEGHINQLVKRSLEKGNDLFQTLQAACINPVKHYGLDVGTLRVGDSADFIVIDNLENWNVIETWIEGTKVAENGRSLIPKIQSEIVNNFNREHIDQESLALASQKEKIKVIIPEDGQLITKSECVDANLKDGIVMSDLNRDILKIAVVNRYEEAVPAVAFIKNFGLRKGALASSVAHDSHNIIAVGTSDAEIVKVVNKIIDSKGGISVSDETEVDILPLPIAGLMSDADGYSLARDYVRLDKKVKDLGCKLESPFMTLSFMALLVIPELKLSDKGLFDGVAFKFVPVDC